MGKRKRVKRATVAPSTSLLDEAFNIKSDMLDEIKHKYEPKDLKAPEAADELAPEEQQIAKKGRIALVELKQAAPNPEIIEWHDANAPDPVFLAKLKAHPGSVPVPLTWQGREFRSKFAVSGSYKLPRNVYETGIVQQRNVFEETSEKQMAKDRIIPKLGTLDLDLAQLKAAFFKNQKKPNLYRFGQVYSDKIEQEQDFSEFKPGNISDALRKALQISKDEEPPWVPLMRNYGFPEAYGDIQTIGKPPLEVSHWGEH